MASQSIRIVAAFAMLAAYHSADAADAPSDLIVGQWQHRREITNPRPDDAAIEFSKDGSGQLSQTKDGQFVAAKITWKVTETYGTACIVVIDYIIDGPRPKEATPMTWLVAFDGKDAFVTQAMPNRIDFWDRRVK